MTKRTALLGLAGLFTAAGLASGRPGERPANPHVEGREADPLARDFHEAGLPAPVLGSPHRTPAAKPVDALGEVIEGVWDAIVGRLTIPLGPITVDR